jgi:hypothetical protein
MKSIGTAQQERRRASKAFLRQHSVEQAARVGTKQCSCGGSTLPPRTYTGVHRHPAARRIQKQQREPLRAHQQEQQQEQQHQQQQQA